MQALGVRSLHHMQPRPGVLVFLTLAVFWFFKARSTMYRNYCGIQYYLWRRTLKVMMSIFNLDPMHMSDIDVPVSHSVLVSGLGSTTSLHTCSGAGVCST